MLVDIKKIGSITIPTLFHEFIKNSSEKFVILKKKDMDKFNNIQKDIKSGKLIIIDENIDIKKIEKLYNYIEKKSDEIIASDKRNEILSKNYKRDRKKSFTTAINRILNTILLIVDRDEIISFKSKEYIDLLLQFSGTDYYEDLVYKYDRDSDKFLIPYKFYKDFKNKLEEATLVEPIENKNIYAGINVLVPKSQDTTQLFKDALLYLKEDHEEKVSDATKVNILDMGCGSGVLSILASQVYKNSDIELTDIIPEATASAMYNIKKIYDTDFHFDEKEKEMKSDIVTISPKEKISFMIHRTGNMFNKFSDDKKELYDIVLFNAPWIVTKSRNRSELALNDENQETVTNFLSNVKKFLSNEKGFVILGYSNNSGDEVVEKLEEIIRDNKLTIVKIISKRIQSYQSGRKWMKIYTYILKKTIMMVNGE